MKQIQKRNFFRRGFAIFLVALMIGMMPISALGAVLQLPSKAIGVHPTLFPPKIETQRFLEEVKAMELEAITTGSNAVATGSDAEPPIDSDETLEKVPDLLREMSLGTVQTLKTKAGIGLFDLNNRKVKTLFYNYDIPPQFMFETAIIITEELTASTNLRYKSVFFPTISSKDKDEDAVLLYINGAIQPDRSYAISELSNKTLLFPENETVTSYSLEFKNSVEKIGQYEKTIRSEVVLVDQSGSLDNTKSTLTITKKDKPSEILATGNTTFSEEEDVNNAFDPQNLHVGMFVPAGNLFSKLPEEIEYTMKFGFNGKKKEIEDVLAPQAYQVEDATFETKMHKVLSLRSLTITCPTGMDENTYSLYIDGVLKAENLSSKEVYTAEFTKNERDFKIVWSDGSIHKRSTGSREDMVTVNAKYAVDTKSDATDLVSYGECKTKVGGKDMSSLEPENSKEVATYIPQVIMLKNQPEKPNYTPEEDIVFNISQMSGGKFLGDYSVIYLFLDTNTNLSENYYLSQVKINFTPVNRDLIVSAPVIKLRSSDKGSTQSITYTGKPQIDTTIDNKTGQEFNEIVLDSMLLYPDWQGSVDADLLALSNYELANLQGGAELEKFTMKLTYSPKEGKQVTKKTTFENTVNLLLSPSNNVYEPIAVKTTITGKAEINITPLEPETSAPTPETSAPSPETSAPTPETSAPTPETSAPTPETSAPTPETSAPKPAPKPDSRPDPTPETSAPIPETSAPIPETSAPIPETSAPIPETSAPAPNPVPPPNIIDPGKDQKDPTFPPVRDEVIGRVVPDGDGTFILLDENEVPLGRFLWDKSEHIWIYEQQTPLGNLPRTGERSLLDHALPFSAGLLALEIVMIVTGLSRKRLRKKQ